jgi:thiopeptide-type bacteriocin biosynthesis protein
MDLLLEDFGLELGARRLVMKNVRDSFAKEFRVEGALRRQLGEKFRQERAALQELFDPAREAESPLAPGLAILRERSQAQAEVVSELRAAEAAGRLSTPITELAASYLHMHANRMLRSAARAQELVLYDWLHRIYDAKAARLRPEP